MRVEILFQEADTVFELLSNPIGGSDQALIFIPGYLSSDAERPVALQKWVVGIREAGWKGAIYSLLWDASNLEELHRFLDSVAGIPPELVMVYRPNLLAKLPAIKIHYQKIKKRAKRVGREELIPLVNRYVQSNRISLMGHSMGARIINYALRSVAPGGDCFENAFLLGGAISRGSRHKWHEAALGLYGYLVNVYHPEDLILRYPYKMLNFRFKNPCGLKPIKYHGPNVVNINAADYMDGYKLTNHWVYRMSLAHTVAPFF